MHSRNGGGGDWLGGGWFQQYDSIWLSIFLFLSLSLFPPSLSPSPPSLSFSFSRNITSLPIFLGGGPSVSMPKIVRYYPSERMFSLTRTVRERIGQKTRLQLYTCISNEWMWIEKKYLYSNFAFSDVYNINITHISITQTCAVQDVCPLILNNRGGVIRTD